MLANRMLARVTALRAGLNGNQLLTAEELAERWQVSAAQVYRLAREGGVPSVRIGRYVRFRRDVIDRWESGEEVQALQPVGQ